MTNYSINWLDLERAELAFGDEATIREILHMVADQLKKQLPDVEDSFANNNLANVKAILHGWNGTLGHFVVEPLAEAVKNTELAAAHNEGQLAHGTFQQCRSQLHELIQEIEGKFPRA